MSCKRNCLFILPTISLGGTTTAMASILNTIVINHINVDVFTVIRGRQMIAPVSAYDIKMNTLTTAFYGNFDEFDIWNRVFFLPIKLLKQFSTLESKLEKWIINRTISQIIKTKQYDYIIGFQEGLATRFASYFSCNKKIAWIHCDYARTFGSEAKERSLYGLFSSIVCVSNFTRKSFLENYPEFTNKTLAIHNLFDANRIIELSRVIINDPRFNTSNFTIISLGRICDVKRFNLIPSIVAKIKQMGIKLRWYILGNVVDQGELNKLQNSIENYDVKEEVIYLGSKSNPYPYLRESDLLVTVSSSVSLSSVSSEPASC